MSTNRFFISTSDIKDDHVRLSPEQSHQVQHVLRLEAGDTIVVLDDTGTEYSVTLKTVEKRQTTGTSRTLSPPAASPPVQVTLFQSMLMREKFEWVLQKGTEIGIARFAPVLTPRSLVRTKDITDNKRDRWHRILVEAAEQSHRGRIPDARPRSPPSPRLLPKAPCFDRCFIAAPSHEGPTLCESLQGMSGKAALRRFDGGPGRGLHRRGGGRSSSRPGAIPISLGPPILRTETFAPVASALILHELGEMVP